MEEVERKNKELSKQRSGEVKSGTPQGTNHWSSYPQKELASPSSARQ